MTRTTKPRGKSKQHHQPPEVYAPTPQQIQEACEAIQASWSERERRKRAWSDPRVSWMPPVVQQDFTRTDSSVGDRNYQPLI